MDSTALMENIAAALRAARSDGQDKALKLAAKIVAKLEKSLAPDFATEIEVALRARGKDEAE
jgi:hypothetical protein